MTAVGFDPQMQAWMHGGRPSSSNMMNIQWPVHKVVIWCRYELVQVLQHLVSSNKGIGFESQWTEKIHTGRVWLLSRLNKLELDYSKAPYDKHHYEYCTTCLWVAGSRSAALFLFLVRKNKLPLASYAYTATRENKRQWSMWTRQRTSQQRLHHHHHVQVFPIK